MKVASSDAASTKVFVNQTPRSSGVVSFAEALKVDNLNLKECSKNVEVPNDMALVCDTMEAGCKNFWSNNNCEDKGDY